MSCGGGGGCGSSGDADCSLCALNAIRRELARLGPPTSVRAVSIAGQEDWTLESSCASSRFTHVYVGTAGTLILRGDFGEITLQNVVAGMWHPVPFAKVIGYASTATDILVGWVS